jgi:hypothetical protein
MEVVMKNTSFVLAIAAGTLVAGCRDSNGIDPVSDQSGGSEQVTRTVASEVSRPAPQDNAIILDAVLAEPGLKFKGMVKIDGRVEYKLNAIVNQDPTAVEFNLATNAQLYPLYVLSNPDDQATCGWWVSDASHHVVYLSDKGVGSLSRNYKIEGRNDIYLRLQFQIAQKNIQVTGMSLRVSPKAADPT